MRRIEPEDGESHCFDVAAYGDDRQATYFRAMVDAAERHRMPLVTWWSWRDLLPHEVQTSCPCAGDAQLCAILDYFRRELGALGMSYVGELLFKGFGGKGAVDHEGRPKPLLDVWRAARGG